MKVWEWLKIFKMTHPKPYRDNQYDLFYNNVKLENLKVINFKLHHDLYKELRYFKTPQYTLGWFFRNKKGFNTWFFQQNYDVIITDKDGFILDYFINLAPDFVSTYYPTAHKIFFFTSGTINHLEIHKKQQLTVALKWLRN